MFSGAAEPKGTMSLSNGFGDFHTPELPPAGPISVYDRLFLIAATHTNEQ